ncbi:basic proline-rich protein-like [Manacus candei]|uniref:basic proline-rich protein-like n=1 Tax=Manacus candei TaxID=415023 RepID=UPI0022274C16|nr:basic proline-rich protein-like [Manacus candei]
MQKHTNFGKVSDPGDQVYFSKSDSSGKRLSPGLQSTPPSLPPSLPPSSAASLGHSRRHRPPGAGAGMRHPRLGPFSGPRRRCQATAAQQAAPPEGRDEPSRAGPGRAGPSPAAPAGTPRPVTAPRVEPPVHQFLPVASYPMVGTTEKSLTPSS